MKNKSPAFRSIYTLYLIFLALKVHIYALRTFRLFYTECEIFSLKIVKFAASFEHISSSLHTIWHIQFLKVQNLRRAMRALSTLHSLF